VNGANILVTIPRLRQYSSTFRTIATGSANYEVYVPAENPFVGAFLPNGGTTACPVSGSRAFPLCFKLQGLVFPPATAEKIGKRHPRTGNTGRVAEIATGGSICFPRICFRESPALPGTHWERCTQTGLAPFPIVRDCQGTFQETMRVNLPLLPWTGT
jgi:hypothetical protein